MPRLRVRPPLGKSGPRSRAVEAIARSRRRARFGGSGLPLRGWFAEQAWVKGCTTSNLLGRAMGRPPNSRRVLACFGFPRGLLVSLFQYTPTKNKFPLKTGDLSFPC